MCHLLLNVSKYLVKDRGAYFSLQYYKNPTVHVWPTTTSMLFGGIQWTMSSLGSNKKIKGKKGRHVPSTMEALYTCDPDRIRLGQRTRHGQCMGASGAEEIIENFPSGQLSICPRAIAQKWTHRYTTKKPTRCFFPIILLCFSQLCIAHYPVF